MSFFSGKSESTPHEIRWTANDPRVQLAMNGTTFRVILHADAVVGDKATVWITIGALFLIVGVTTSIRRGPGHSPPKP